MKKPELSANIDVDSLIELFDSRMNRIKELFENGDILDNQQYIEDTEKIIQQIEDITGEYRIELTT